MVNINIIHAVNGIAILSTGIVFGTDMFYALVGKKAAANSKKNSIEDLLGHTHAIADKCMPVIGATSVITTVALIIIYGFKTFEGWLAIIALAGLLTQLIIYIRISQPINKILSEGALSGRVVSNVRQLQNKWDSVIEWRAFGLTVAMICLVLMNYV